MGLNFRAMGWPAGMLGPRIHAANQRDTIDDSYQKG